VPHIDLGNDEFGIRSLLKYRPETARPMGMLAEVLMRGPGTLTAGERELIATYVSSRNECSYCTDSHAASAAVRLPGGMTQVDQVLAGPETAPITPKLAALLRIAGAVQQNGKAVREEDPRHRPHRRRILYVQPLCGRARHHGAARPGRVPDRRTAEHQQGVPGHTRPVRREPASRVIPEDVAVRLRIPGESARQR
jgi:AhpD family alkylhydroperoxidase